MTIGTIPVDVSDDADDRGSISNSSDTSLSCFGEVAEELIPDTLDAPA